MNTHVLREDRWRRRGPRQLYDLIHRQESTKQKAIRKTAHLAPDMAGMFVHECLSGVAEEQLRNDQEADVFFAVQRLFEDVTTVTVGCEFNDPTSTVACQ